MTREDIDVMWQRALHDSVRDGEQFTRYHFAKMVEDAAFQSWVAHTRQVVLAEREACAKVCEAGIKNATDWDSSSWDQACENRAYAIRARGQQ